MKNFINRFAYPESLIGRAVLMLFLLLVLINFFYALDTLLNFKESRKYSIQSRKIFFLFTLAHVPALVWFVTLLIQDCKHKHISLIRRLAKYYSEAPLPKPLKFLVIIIGGLNLLCIVFQKSSYPFYDVGMFKHPKKFANPPKEKLTLKYYYKTEFGPKILELRREHLPWMREFTSWRHNNEFTFSAHFHNKGRPETYDYLVNLLRPHGIDLLWVGTQTVNYETRQVSFDPDPVRAVKINNTGQVYYGPIFIPDHQMQIYEQSKK